MTPDAFKPACPQCGGPVPLPEGDAYAHCPFCGSESFVDLSGALLYQVIKPTVGLPRARGLIETEARDAGWPEARPGDLKLTYEPVWELELADEKRLRISARPGPDGRIDLIDLPGGERDFLSPGRRERGADWLEPELAPESVAEVAARATGRPVGLKSTRLVHRPAFVGDVVIGGVRYGVRIDAVSGRLIDADWPLQPRYGARNHAWTATAIMAVTALVLPFPWSLAAVAAVAGFALVSLSRRATQLARSGA